MIFEYFPLGSLGANCYILGCEETKEGVVIDPGGDPGEVLKFLMQQGLRLKYIINTHGHIDHIQGNEDLRKATGAQLLIHEAEAELLANPAKNLSAFLGEPVVQAPADRLLKEGDKIEAGTITLQVIHTPGHTKGGICLLTGDKLFSGDTLFAGSIGRTDFPGGSYEELINSVRSKLFILPDETRVYAGHGPESAIGYEKKTNPFFQ